MAEFEVKLPDLVEASGDDEAGDTGKVSFFYVEEGESVAEGDDLVELVTDKATFNVPSPKTGSVARILVAEDDDVKVGQVLCVLEVEG